MADQEWPIGVREIPPRRRESIGSETRFRVLAYAWVGLLALLQAPEALAVFVALAVVDLPSARANDRRSLGVVLGAFLVSLLPFFLTNQLIAGNPIEPPWLLSPSDLRPQWIHFEHCGRRRPAGDK